jgi:hypothetical protein
MAACAGWPLTAGSPPPGGAGGMGSSCGQQAGQCSAGLLQLAVLAAGRRVRDRRDPVVFDEEEPGSPARPQVMTITIWAGGRP